MFWGVGCFRCSQVFLVVSNCFLVGFGCFGCFSFIFWCFWVFKKTPDTKNSPIFTCLAVVSGGVWGHVFHATSPAVSDEHGLLCLVIAKLSSNSNSNSIPIGAEMAL